MNPHREKIKLEPITPELINEVVERIVKAIDPDKIILFGSFAKGNPHEYSDLDLFIIKSEIDNYLILQGQVDSLFWDHSFPLDVLVRSPEQVERALKGGNSFLKYEILGKGKVLYEKSLLSTQPLSEEELMDIDIANWSVDIDGKIRRQDDELIRYGILTGEDFT